MGSPGSQALRHEHRNSLKSKVAGTAMQGTLSLPADRAAQQRPPFSPGEGSPHSCSGSAEHAHSPLHDSGVALAQDLIRKQSQNLAKRVETDVVLHLFEAKKLQAL